MHQFEDGPVLAANHPFLPGETVFFSCRLTGYQTAASPDDMRSVKLSWKLAVRDPADMPLVPEKTGRIDEPVFAQDKNWLPKFLHSFEIPAFAPGGTYHIEVEAKDEVGKTEFSSRLEFRVRGHEVEPSATLVGRNLKFLRSEQDAPPIDPVLYHQGETLWARFDITGYKYGEKNHYEVEYGLAILKESGEQVFAQPGAASDTHESYYPQRYVPGAVSLNLDPNVPEGVYTLVVTIEDKVGGQKAEARGTFRIAR